MKYFENLFKKIGSKDMNKLLPNFTVILLIGIFIVIASNYFIGEDSNETDYIKTLSNNNSHEDNNYMEDYSTLVERKLENILNQIKGVDKVKVMVTVEETIERLTENDELIVFTDMYGGSPFNAVCKSMKNKDFYHITGINFPLFIDIAINRSSYSMEEIAEKIIKNGKKSIVFVNEKFTTD